MISQEQDKRWADLSENSKKFILERYDWLKNQRSIAVDIHSHREYQLGINEWEEMYGSHNLNQKPLTYEDVDMTVFQGKPELLSIPYKGEIWRRKIKAISNLLVVAKSLNEGWKPDWKDEDNKFYTLGIDPYDNSIKIIEVNTCGMSTEVVYFRTKEIAQQAIQILGEDVVRMALTMEY